MRSRLSGERGLHRARASTRRSYVALIVRIEKTFADFPLAALADPRTRGIFKTWRVGAAARHIAGPVEDQSISVKLVNCGLAGSPDMNC
jgi:hypothetical protein